MLHSGESGESTLQLSMVRLFGSVRDPPDVPGNGSQLNLQGTIDAGPPTADRIG